MPLGYFFNEPTKSSLIVEKSPNLVTLNLNIIAKCDQKHIFGISN
jgi:hypothetical protein